MCVYMCVCVPQLLEGLSPPVTAKGTTSTCVTSDITSASWDEEGVLASLSGELDAALRDASEAGARAAALDAACAQHEAHIRYVNFACPLFGKTRGLMSRLTSSALARLPQRVSVLCVCVCVCVSCVTLICRKLSSELSDKQRDTQRITDHNHTLQRMVAELQVIGCR